MQLSLSLSCPQHHWGPPLKNLRQSQHYGIEGFKGGPKLGSHHAKIRQTLGQRMYDFAIWLHLIHTGSFVLSGVGNCPAPVTQLKALACVYLRTYLFDTCIYCSITKAQIKYTMKPLFMVYLIRAFLMLRSVFMSSDDFRLENKWHPLSERLASLGIMGAQFKALLNFSILWWSERFQEVLNWVHMIAERR